MRVFITGGSGFVGLEVVKELIKHGHQVLALARSDASVKVLTDAGADVLRGDLEDYEILEKGASSTDGVIHLGFINDFSNFERAVAVDTKVIETLGNALKDTNRPFIVTSGALVQKSGIVSTEESELSTTMPRTINESIAHSFRSQGVRTVVVRLAPTVHDIGDHVFVPMLFESAQKHGTFYIVGEGKNRWSAVHRKDAAVLFRLALEKAPSGSTLLGSAEESIEFRKIAEIIAKQANVPIKSVTQEEATNILGFMAFPIGVDISVSNAKTRELVGWKPTHISLFEDIDRPAYYQH